MTNSSRFISAYNKIDRALRNSYGFKPSLSFADMVRKASLVNSFVGRFSDEILSYARLRNAIVHSSEDEKVIAEPHDNVTDHIERIAEILNRPPRAEKFAHQAASVQNGLPLSKTVSFMVRGNYSNVPVLHGNQIIGVVTNKMIVQAIESHLAGDIAAFLSQTPVEQILTADACHFQIVPTHTTALDVIECFAANRKLALLILTENGKPDADIRGVLTASDLPALSDAVS